MRTITGREITLTDTKVAGKKTIVRTAMVFIAELSRLLASAMLLESCAIPTFRRLSLCAMRLKTYNWSEWSVCAQIRYIPRRSGFARSFAVFELRTTGIL